MRGLILAAGRGSRMGPATTDQPKCFTRLAGRRLVDWQLAALRAAGIHEIAAVTGYCRQAVEGLALPTFHNPRWMETQMVASARRAGEWLVQDDCVLSYSDIAYHPTLVEALMRSTAPIAIVYDTLWESLWRSRFDDPLADAERFRVDARGRLAEIGGRAAALEQIEGQYIGLLRFSADGYRQIERCLAQLPQAEADRLDMTAMLARLIGSGVEVECVAVHGRWCEVDSQADAAKYEARLQQGPWSHDFRF